MRGSLICVQWGEQGGKNGSKRGVNSFCTANVAASDFLKSNEKGPGRKQALQIPLVNPLRRQVLVSDVPSRLADRKKSHDIISCLQTRVLPSADSLTFVMVLMRSGRARVKSLHNVLAVV